MKALFALSFVLLLTGLGIASERDKDRRVHSSILVQSTNAQVLEGANLYYEKCSACHGDRALGLEEARLSFPEDHQACERCHKRNNPRQMDIGAMTWRNAFSIGNAPALQGENALADLANGLVLYGFIRSTMPRPFPGKLNDEDYLAITAFLLEANGVSLANTTLSEDNALEFELERP